jgi:hypothetical protein
LAVDLNGGVNLSDPVTHLKPGELAFARNSHYNTESQELEKILGRRQVGSALSGNPEIKGVSYVQFLSGIGYLIVAAGNQYWTTPVTGGGSGTFTSRATLSQPAGFMEARYFNGTDRAYIIDGINRMRVWDGENAMRVGGLLAPSAAVLTFIDSSTTFYVKGTTFQMCHSEYRSDDAVESAPSPVISQLATEENGTFLYTLPVTNTNGSDFDKYRIYRTQNGGNIFYLLAEIPKAALAYYDGTGQVAPDRGNTDTDLWGFHTVEDILLSHREIISATGQPLLSNYVSVNGEVPRGDIMTVFENQLVIAGVPGYTQDVYQSRPNNPEQFSPAEWWRSETGKGEPIHGMGVANDQLVIFHDNSIYRVNTLPAPEDPGYGLGLSRRQLVADDHGCIAKRTVINYGVGQSNNKLFYLAAHGPMTTDGYNTAPLDEDLNWSKDVLNFGVMSRAVALNFPKYDQIRLFVPSKDSLYNDICFIYHYHPNHRKKGMVGKWTGPCDVRCADGATAYDPDVETRIFIGDSIPAGDLAGAIFQEDEGLKDEQLLYNAAGDIVWEWKTGDGEITGESKRKRIQRCFLDVVSNNGFDPLFTLAVNKQDVEKPLQLNLITNNSRQVSQFGESWVEQRRSRSFRAIAMKAGSHFRFHLTEAAQGERAVAQLELEVQSWGRQR